MVKENCYRCTKPVYPTDKVGPLKDSTFFHHGCFKCYICGTRLALKTYFNNRNNIEDKEIYCSNHVPNANPHDLPVLTNRNKSSTDIIKSNVRGYKNHPADAGIADLKIAHAIKATQVAKPYPKIIHGGANYVVDYDTQTRLELIHREMEDKLYEEFNDERQREMREFEKETKEEWEKALDEFAKKYHKGQIKENKSKDELIRCLTLKREKKLETLNMKRRERERMKTAELVDKQAMEMLELFRQARNNDNSYEQNNESQYNYQYPLTPPPPTPPLCSKKHIYTETTIFEEIDKIAISVAQSDVCTFTDLIRYLTINAQNDMDKARAIYRWITVKNLNVMIFDNNIETDTPMGLLRGIKYGTESYHVLFKRLCAYAGLHCVVIRGYSKSAGYQPGYKFDDSRFRNTWNAVYLDGSWRFVQCNWGARHLVNAKDSSNNNNNNNPPSPKDSTLRYEYDDHYFMTDPEEFIYEFFPLDEEWQLLRKPITLQQFENLPFVRSLFFKYGLKFVDPNIPAIINSDDSGAATISLNIKHSDSKFLIFHYNLRFFDSDCSEINGYNMKRFVMQSSLNDTIIFRVHCPSTRPMLLDVFANQVLPEHYLTGQPIKFKSVCKFKIQCKNLSVIMVPLPECASGEWGPPKAYRLFELVPLTHEDPIITCGQHLEIKFKMLQPLAEFVCSLHKNNVDDRRLQKCCKTFIYGDEVSIRIEFPDEGQYGLDIYTRNSKKPNINGKQLLTHCCKYLINSRA
uniref:LIM zinc-binding domain-containing protein n=1 Tax=Strongyloides stercoralis TaxID=6248 RepID=A0A0K0EKG5_STRER